MTLPTLNTPQFFTKIPSTGQEIRYRPFLVKEQKILYFALESEDPKEIQNAMLRIVDSCIEDKLEKPLTTFDMEYLFLKLRCVSVGETVEFKITHSDGDCPEEKSITIRLDDIEPDLSTMQDGKIMLTEDVGIQLRYPDVMTAVKISEIDKSRQTLAMIAHCIEYVFDNKKVYKDSTPDELEEYVESFTKDQLMKVLDFFKSAPKLSKTIKWECERCGRVEEKVIEGAANFFALG